MIDPRVVLPTLHRPAGVAFALPLVPALLRSLAFVPVVGDALSPWSKPMSLNPAAILPNYRPTMPAGAVFSLPSSTKLGFAPKNVERTYHAPDESKDSSIINIASARIGEIMQMPPATVGYAILRWQGVDHGTVDPYAQAMIRGDTAARDALMRGIARNLNNRISNGDWTGASRLSQSIVDLYGIAVGTSPAGDPVVDTAPVQHPEQPVVFATPPQPWWQSGTFVGATIIALGFAGYAAREHYKQDR